MAQTSPGVFGPHRHQTGLILRELLCRTCGRWMEWRPAPDAIAAGPDGRWLPEQGAWYHGHDSTPECPGSLALEKGVE